MTKKFANFNFFLRYFVFSLSVIVFLDSESFAQTTTKISRYSCPSGYTMAPALPGIPSNTCLMNSSYSNCQAYGSDLVLLSQCFRNEHYSGNSAAATLVGSEINGVSSDAGQAQGNTGGACPPGQTKMGDEYGGGDICVSTSQLNACRSRVSRDDPFYNSSIFDCVQGEGDYAANGNGESNNQPGSEQSGGTCDAAHMALVQECQDKTQTAVSRCDENSDSGIANLSRNIENSLQVAQGASNQLGINSACSSLNKIMTSANAAMATFKGVCEYNIASCNSSCRKAMDDATAKGCDTLVVRAATDQCSQLRSKATQIAAGLQQTMAGVQQSRICNELSAGSLEALCKANPNSPGCAQLANSNDCSNPANASNPVCLCRANPFDPSCGGGAGKTNNQQMASTDNGIRSAAKLSDLGPTPNFEEPQVPTSGNGRTPSGNLGGGKQGGSANLALSGGGVGGGAMGSEGGAGGGGLNANIMNGFRGGGAMGGGSAGSRGGSYGGSGSNRGAYGGTGSYAGKNGQPDLRQFLPGGNQYRRRGVGGTGTGPDGITGPHGSIWKQVQGRYRSLQHTLLP